MRRLATLAVVAALMSQMTASGQDYTFGDWARGHGYSPGDVMPEEVWANSSSPAIDNLDGISEFDWTTTPTLRLSLDDNQISSIESGDFSGLTNLDYLHLNGNQISNIESGDFSGLTDLRWLYLRDNQISSIESGAWSGLTNLMHLLLDGNQISSIESGDFSGLTKLFWLDLDDNQISSLESGDFSGLTKLWQLDLRGNQLTSLESGDFSGLTKLARLYLNDNQISSLESGDFSGLTALQDLRLEGNQLTSLESGAFSGPTDLFRLLLGQNTTLIELNLAEADFSLGNFDLEGNVNITSVSLRKTVMNQFSLAYLMNGGGSIYTGIGELGGITQMDLSGVDFANISDLKPLYVMDDLIDLWLVDTVSLDATDLDVLLDNLATIEGTDTEGILHMTYANFDGFSIAGSGLLAAWDAELGHHVEFIGSLLLGDVNHDGAVDGLDVDPFIDVLLDSQLATTADMNGDGAVNGLDVAPFVAAVFGGGTQPIPEPSAILLALGVVGGWPRESARFSATQKGRKGPKRRKGRKSQRVKKTPGVPAAPTRHEGLNPNPQPSTLYPTFRTSRGGSFIFSRTASNWFRKERKF